MCNLNIVFKLKEKNITPFLMAVTSNSFSSNDDGDGLYTDSNDKVVKSLNKLNLFEYQEEIDKSKVIITHQRLSTSGHTIEYCHPFESREFILVHNGIINQFLGSEGSDTSGFFDKFLQVFSNDFNSSKVHISREERIVKTLRKLFTKDEGSYSILIYDKKTGKGYYFRNTPSINFYKFKELLYITTSYSNEKFLSLLNIDEKFKELDVKSNIIYRISDKLEVFNIGELCFGKKETKFTDKYISNKEICSMCHEEINHASYYSGGSVYCESCIEFCNQYSGVKK